MKQFTAQLEHDRQTVGSGAIPSLRWWMIGLVALATTINYVDRQSISLLFPVMGRADQLDLTPLQYSRVGSALLLAYMISQSVSGKFYDRFGNRIGFAVSIVIWSCAAMGHAAITGFASFAALSFVLGFGEAGNWPGAAKVVAEWFPLQERAFAMAIFNSGAALGSVIAPPLVVGLELRFGWRRTFLMVGSLGFIWLAIWLASFWSPSRHPRISEAEHDYIMEGRMTMPAASPRVSWSGLLRIRQTWAIVIGRFFVDPVWWLFVLWLPEYLNKARGLSLRQIGMFAWVPYAAASAGSLCGGWLAGRLISSGTSVDRARKIVILGSACLMPAGLLAAKAPTPLGAIAFIGVVLFGFQAWISNVQTLPSDFFSARSVGSVAGLGGTGAALGSMSLTLATGWIITHFSYGLVLTIAGVLPVLGTAALILLAGRIQPLEIQES